MVRSPRNGTERNNAMLAGSTPTDNGPPSTGSEGVMDSQEAVPPWLWWVHSLLLLFLFVFKVLTLWYIARRQNPSVNGSQTHRNYHTKPTGKATTPMLLQPKHPPNAHHPMTTEYLSKWQPNASQMAAQQAPLYFYVSSTSVTLFSWCPSHLTSINPTA